MLPLWPLIKQQNLEAYTDVSFTFLQHIISAIAHLSSRHVRKPSNKQYVPEQRGNTTCLFRCSYTEWNFHKTC